MLDSRGCDEDPGSVGAGPTRGKPRAGRPRAAVLRAGGVLLGVVLALSHPAARDPAPRPHQYVVEHWTVERGLPQNTVTSIAQTPDGFLWFGTLEGLVRFDGVEFREYNPENTPAIPDSHIVSLALDSRGTLWVGTYDGSLLALTPKGFTRRVPSPGAVGRRPLRIRPASPDGVWLWDVDGRVRRFQGGRFSGETNGNPSGDREVRDVLEDRQGRLWIGTTRGLACLDHGNRREWGPSGGLCGSRVTALAETADGAVLALTEAGINRFEKGTLARVTPVPAFRDREPRVACPDRRGTLWVGTGKGIVRLLASGTCVITQADGLTDDVIFSLCEDRDGGLWAGTFRGGVNRLSEGPFRVYDTADGLPDPCVLTVCPDPAGRLWVGTLKGLAVLGPDDRPSAVLSPDPRSPAAVWSICPSAAGGMWVGFDQGIGRFRSDLSPVRVPPLPENSLVFALWEHPSGSLWAGVLGKGLWVLDQGVWRREDRVPAGVVRGIARDAAGTVWLATENGLFGLPEGPGASWSRVGGLPPEEVFCLLPRGNDLWVGTNGGGLCRVRGGRTAVVSPKAGLPNGRVFQVLDDGAGSFWMGCNRGIFRVSVADLDAVADGRSGVVRAERFGLGDGLKSLECNGGLQPAGCRTADGRLWFPTNRGLAAVDPRAATTVRPAPAARVETVRVDGDPRDPAAALDLDASAQALEFQFLAPCFVKADRVRFRQFLSGFDKGWVDAGKRRSAVYTNLPPGRYRFSVQAYFPDGAPGPVFTSAPVTVHAPIWKRTWFQALLVMACALALVLGYRATRWVLAAFRLWRRTHWVGPYRILERVDSGGEGTVFRARDRRNRQVVALKVLDRNLVDPEARDRLFRELEIGRRRIHPAVVRTLDHGEAGGRLYLVMEFVEGRTLRAVLREGVLPVPAAVELFLAVLEVVEAIHREGVTHRDLKPDNIILLGDARQPADPVAGAAARDLKVLDLGMARLADGSTLTRTGLLMGTMDYLPPEYLSGAVLHSPAIDLYACGIILYEMLTGTKPFADSGEDLYQRLYAVLNRDPEPVTTFRPSLPPDLARLVMSLIARRVEDRLVDIPTIRARARRLLDGPGVLP
ncbi:MAG: protein kinase [Acidobacteria bacterium]|nr:protein kinase [Acidobacteriota bacterium]